MFALKQAIGVLVLPATLALLLVVASGVLALRGRARAATYTFPFGALLAYLGAIPLVGNALLAPLESQYAASAVGEQAPPDFVVVLGSGYLPRSGVPITSALDREGLARIVEGIRLTRSLSGATLIVSGGAPEGSVPSALGYAELAAQLGIDRAALIVLDTPLDTAAEARAVVAEIGQAPFLLVTAASHMPRAMRRMEAAGARPIPAPTAHLASAPHRLHWRDFLPTSAGMLKSERAMHEYAGLVALTLGID
jgi:uncharacterized SAM-binding protein YcdF (DUF218 family)